jgi:AraC-like DNA-binding protein
MPYTLFKKMFNQGKKTSKRPAKLIWKAVISDRIFLLGNILCFIVLTAVYLLFFKTNEFVFFPGQVKPNVSFYTDRYDNGHSYLEKLIKTDSVVGIRFVLTEGFLFPYAGLEITNEKQKYFDLSKFNKVKIEASSETLKSLYIYLHVKDRSVKDTVSEVGLRRLVKDINVGSYRQSIEVSFNDFITQDWWYNKVNQPKSDFSNPSFSKVRSINISTGLNPPKDTLSDFKIYKISFYRDNFVVILVIISVQIILTVTLFFLRHRNKSIKPEKKSIDINYKPIEVNNGNRIRTGYNFLDYINTNYSDPELNLTQIAKATGVGSREISDTISEKFGCNIKTYINQIRIMESKRLLLESDLKVNEIAYKVGFNSPMNFNRVFKTLTGDSPLEYVKKNRVAKSS